MSTHGDSPLVAQLLHLVMRVGPRTTEQERAQPNLARIRAEHILQAPATSGM